MSLQHIKALDGIRFLAVTLVLLDHWSGDQLGFPAGYLGVCLFFVLSGYLITRILLHAKSQDDLHGRSYKKSLQRFFIRRTIRIFPLYYLTLLALWFLDVPAVREKMIWLVTYTTNVYMAAQATWIGSSDHLWSLAVEEQYYLFFPFLLFFIPQKRTGWIFPAFLLFSVGIRLYFYITGVSWIASYVLMFTCLDAFGLGGWLAYVQFHKSETWLKRFRQPSTVFIALVLYLIVLYLGHQPDNPHNAWITVALRLFESLLSVTMIGLIVEGMQRPSPLDRVRPILECTPIVFIGKISYGIYLFHNYVFNYYHTPPDHPVVKIVQKLGQYTHWFELSWWPGFFLYYAITVAMATCSWYLIEQPINDLKRHFDYTS